MQHKLTDFLTVTDDQFDAVTTALATRGIALSRKRFLTARSWTVVPDGEGRPSKAELTLLRPKRLLPGRTLLNLWLAPDIRQPGTAWPHGHPADFESEIVYGGGYTEMRYGRNASGIWSAEHTYRLSQRNLFPLDLFHEVVDVAPGTLSIMRWDQIVRPGGWGNLNIDTGEFTLTKPDPAFRAMLRAVNPQHPGRWGTDGAGPVSKVQSSNQFRVIE
jgi:hypothetical protein